MEKEIAKMKHEIRKKIERQGPLEVSRQLGLNVSDVSRFLHYKAEWSWKKVYNCWSKLCKK